MKIVRKGKIKKNRIYSGRCNNCSALVECTEKEMDQHLFESFIHRIKCPTKKCEYFIYLLEGSAKEYHL